MCSLFIPVNKTKYEPNLHVSYNFNSYLWYSRWTSSKQKTNLVEICLFPLIFENLLKNNAEKPKLAKFL